MMRRTFLQSLGASAALGALAPNAAMAVGRTRARDDGAELIEIADNVFAIIHADATDEWPHGNTGVIVGRRSVFVIDSCYLPSRARADIALIRLATDKPVSKLATTHWHFDHNFGAVAYREAFPAVELIAERETARWIELNQIYWQRLSTAPDATRVAALAALEGELETVAGQERADRARRIAARRGELEELGAAQVIRPERVFDARLELDFEGVPVHLVDQGPANSPHDVTFWLPRQRILFAGDIVVNSPLPYTGASWPVHWAPVLRRLEASPIAAMVPGHGPVMADHAYTAAVRALLEAALARVEAMIRQGRTLQQIQDALDLGDVRAGVPSWNGPGVSEDDWTYTVRALAERCFVGLRGQGGR